MKYLHLVALFLIGTSVQAQDELEKISLISKEIAQLQLKSDGYSYTIGNQKKTIGFSPTNFVTYINNQTSIQSVFNSVNGIDTLIITDPVPLDKIIQINTKHYGNLSVHRLKFSSNLIVWNHYVNGKVVHRSRVDYIEIYSRIVDANEIFRKIGLLVHLIYETNKRLPSGTAKKIDDEMMKYFKLDQNISAHVSALSRLSTMNMGIYQNTLNGSLTYYQSKLAESQKINAEAKVLKSRIDQELKMASVTFKNFDHYYRIDTMTKAFIDKYKNTDFKIDDLELIKKINSDAWYRYAWNKEYTEKELQVIAYDQYKNKLAVDTEKYQNSLKRKSNGYAFTRALMLYFGGIAGGIGTYGKFFDEDETYSESTANALFFGGVSAVGSSIIWKSIVNSKIKIANKRMTKTKNEVEAREKVLKDLLQKREEKRDGIPVINLKK